MHAAVAQQMIFYGAGNYAKDNLQRLMSAGYMPICFVDSDPAKHNTIFRAAACEILSLGAAVAKYPEHDFLLSVSGRFCMEIYNHLLSNGVSHRRIRFPDSVAFRKGCPMFENTMVVQGDAIRICCRSLSAFGEIPEDPPFAFPFATSDGESMAKAIQGYNAGMAKLLRKWTGLRESPCDECPYLKQGLYPETVEVWTIHTGTNYKDDVCNFSCIYCNATKVLRDGMGKNFGLYELLVKLSAHIDFQGIIISLSTGEFLARKNSEDILKFLDGKGAKISLTSNSSIYSGTLASLIRNGRVAGINTSLDAGTAETFARVKNTGVDCFKRVRDNITKYSRLGCKYYLKYIILAGINDNENDIYGFIDICKEIRPYAVCISADKNQKYNHLPQRTISLASLLYEKLLACGLKPEWSLDDFNQCDLERIYECIEGNGICV
jgi:pyruvate-formate lyase-activating enzyme